MPKISKQVILIVSLIIVVAIAALFIYGDLFKNKEAALPSAVPVDDTASHISVGLVGGSEDNSGQPAQNTGSTVKVSMPIPDLDRKLVFSVPTSDTAKAQMAIRAAELESILKKNPDSFNDWLDWGVLLKTIGDYNGAKEAWEYASAIRPGNYVSFSNLGDLYHYYLKDYPKAEENIMQAIKNEPSDIAAYRALVDLYTQSYTEKLNQVPVVVNQGLKSNPDNYDLLIMMASYYKDAGDKANAKAYYEKALAVADKAGQGSMKPVLNAEIQNLGQ